jgi:uncharacterized protein YjgD (DUF1641 family)
VDRIIIKRKISPEFTQETIRVDAEAYYALSEIAVKSDLAIKTVASTLIKEAAKRVEIV